MARRTARFTITAEDKTRNAFASATRGIDGLEKRFLSLAGPIAALGGTAGLGFLTRELISLGSTAEEARSKFNTVFGGEADAVRAWANDFSREVGRSRLSVEEWLSGLQDTLVPLGFMRGEAAGLSEEITRLAVDMGSFYNATDEQVINSITSALVGNHDAIRRYGVVITENALKQEALASGLGKTYSELTELEKVQLRLNLIMKGTTDAQGDATDTAGQLANQLKRLKGNTRDFGVIAGEALVPAVNEVVVAMNEWMQANEDVIGSRIEDTVGRIADAFSGIAENKEGLDAVLEVTSLIASGLVKAAEGWSMIASMGKNTFNLGNNMVDMLRGDGQGPINSRFMASRSKNPLNPFSWDRMDDDRRRSYYDRGDSPAGDSSYGGGIRVPEFPGLLDSSAPTKTQTAPAPDLPLDIAMPDYEAAHEEYLDAETAFQDELEGLWLKCRQSRIELESDGLEQQKELLRLYYEYEFGMLADSDQRKILARETLHNELEALERAHLVRTEREQRNAAVTFGKRWGDVLYDMEGDAATRFGRIGDMFERLIERMMVQMAMTGLFALATGGTSAVLPAVKDVFKGGFGGFRAGGGPVSRGRAYVVGEKRPELFIPDRNGTVLPYVPGAGAQKVVNDNSTVVINVDGGNATEGAMMTAYEFAELYNQAKQMELIDADR